MTGQSLPQRAMEANSHAPSPAIASTSGSDESTPVVLTIIDCYEEWGFTLVCDRAVRASNARQMLFRQPMVLVPTTGTLPPYGVPFGCPQIVVTAYDGHEECALHYEDCQHIPELHEIHEGFIDSPIVIRTINDWNWAETVVIRPEASITIGSVARQLGSTELLAIWQIEQRYTAREWRQQCEPDTRFSSDSESEGEDEHIYQWDEVVEEEAAEEEAAEEKASDEKGSVGDAVE